jgi:hypothetical protein
MIIILRQCSHTDCDTDVFIKCLPSNLEHIFPHEGPEDLILELLHGKVHHYAVFIISLLKCILRGEIVTTEDIGGT